MTGQTPPDAITRHNALRRGAPDALEPIEKVAAGRYSASLLAAVRAALAVDERERPQSVAVLRTILGLRPGGASRGEAVSTLMAGANRGPSPRESPAGGRPLSIERGLRSVRLGLTMILVGFALISVPLVDDMRNQTGFLKIGDEMVPIARGLAVLFGMLLALIGAPALLALLGGRVLALWLAIGAAIIGLLELLYLSASVPNIRGAADLAATPVEFYLTTIGLVLIGLAAIPLWSRSVRALRRAAAAMEQPLGRAIFAGRWFKRWVVALLVVVSVGAAALALARPWDAVHAPRAADAPRPGSGPAACRDGVGWRARCVFRDCPGCPEMVVIPGDTFVMGSPANEKDGSSNERPQHSVSVRPFALGKYDVTRGEFAAFVRETGHRPSDAGGCQTLTAAKKIRLWDADADWSRPGFAQNDRHPVVCVNWDDAKAYAAWLSRKTGNAYRLPSEAEWEYAARAGTTTRLFWGDDSGYGNTCRYANTADQRLKQSSLSSSLVAPCDDGHIFTAPVGSYAANGFGLFDMSGNVLKWNEDCPHTSNSGAPSDGSAWTTGGDCKQRVLRGGSWDFGPGALRSAFRYWTGTSSRTNDIGFRLARTL